MSEAPGREADRRIFGLPPDVSASSPRCRCCLATLSSPVGDIILLHVAGEVDLRSFAVLETALDDVLDRLPEHLVIDLTELFFCSSYGLSAITRTARAATANGTRYSICATSPLIRRLGPHLWPEGGAPPIHRTVAGAVRSHLVA